jgi:hypothetical protein
MHMARQLAEELGQSYQAVSKAERRAGGASRIAQSLDGLYRLQCDTHNTMYIAVTTPS